MTLALLAVLLVLWWVGTEWFRAARVEYRHRTVQAQARESANDLAAVLRERVSLAEGLADFTERRVRAGTFDAEAFESFAAGEYASRAGLRTVQVAPAGRITLTYPLKGNEGAIGLDLLRFPDPEVRGDVLRAWNSDAPVFSGPYTLAQGGTGYVVRRSVHEDGKVWGLAAVVMDVPEMLRETGLSHAPAGMILSITDAHGRLVGLSGAATMPPDPERAKVSVAGAGWTVALVPAGGWEDTSAGATLVIRTLGLFVVVLFGLVFYLVMSRQRRLARAVAEATRGLAESERRYRALFEESPVSLWEEDFSALKRALDDLSASGIPDVRTYLALNHDELRRLVAKIRVVDVNRVSTQMYGAPRDQLREGVTPFVTTENASDFADELGAIAEGRLAYGRLTTVESGGRTKYALMTWTVVPGHEDDFGSVVVSVVDLTDRVNAEQELERYKRNLETLVEERTAELREVNEQLIEAQHAKDAFLASMSHELRTPLNSILGFTGVLLRGLTGPLREEQRRQLRMVQRSGQHLLTLVNDVLDLAKLQGGYSEFEPHEFPTAPFVEEVAGSVRPLAEEKGLTLRVELDGAPETMYTDPDRLQQILLNLMGNAVKYTSDGSVSLAVGTFDGQAEFRVTDTGVGIPDGEHDMVFKPFHQLPQSGAAKAPGTGLGLAISRDLAALLGGTLTVTSTPEVGSEFTLRIPYVLDDGEDA